MQLIKREKTFLYVVINMSKIYKQMFNNSIIQIIVITWLIQQQQLTMCIAAWQPLQATAMNPISKLDHGIQAQHKQHNVRDDILHNSTSISEGSTTNNNTAAVAAANNKLYVNNTDTQMTLKLKDATARNVYTKYYNKTLLLAPVTKTANEDSNSSSSKRTTTNKPSLPYNTTKPTETVKISVELTSTTETFADGQLAAEIIRSLETQTTNNVANKTHNLNHHYNHPTNTPALLNITHFTSNTKRPYMKLKRKTLITMTTTAAADSLKLSFADKRKTVEKAKQTIINNLISNNNNLINKTYTKVKNVKNEIRYNTEKGLNSRILKDLPGKYVEKAAAFVDLIEKDKNQQTANEDSSTTSTTPNTTRAQNLHKALDVEKANLNTTNLSFKNNEKEQIVNNEKGVQMDVNESILKGDKNINLTITLKKQSFSENKAAKDFTKALTLSLHLSESKDKNISQEESKAAQLTLETLNLKPTKSFNENNNKSYELTGKSLVQINNTKANDSDISLDVLQLKSLSDNTKFKELTDQSSNKTSHTKANTTKAFEEQELFPQSLSLETESSVSKGKNPSSDNLPELSKSMEYKHDIKAIAPELSMKANNLKYHNLDSESEQLPLENIKGDKKENSPKTLNILSTDSKQNHKEQATSFLQVVNFKAPENFTTKSLRSQKLNSTENTQTAGKENFHSETFLLENTNKSLNKSLAKVIKNKAFSNNKTERLRSRAIQTKINNLTEELFDHEDENKDLAKSFSDVISHQNTTSESSKMPDFKHIKLTEKEDTKAITESLEKENNEKASALLQQPIIDEIDNITDIANQKLKLKTIKTNRPTLAKQKQHSLRSTLLREKRFKAKNLNPNKPTQTLVNLTKPQLENNTESSYDYINDNRTTEQQHMVTPSAITDPLKKSKIESLMPNDTKSIIVVVENKKQNKSKNESVELETADERKLNFTDEQKILPINTTTKGNGNNMMVIENKMNNKQLDAKERQSKDYNKNQNIQLIDEEHVVSEINGINTMTTASTAVVEDKTTATTSKTYLITTPTTVETSATAVSKQILLELPTTVAQPRTTTTTAATLSTSRPFSIFTESLQNTTVTNLFTTTNGPLSIHDLVNTRLNTVSVDIETIPTTYTTTTLMQLVSTTSTATLPPFSYNSTLTSYLSSPTPSPPSSLPSLAVSSASSAAVSSMSSLYSNNFATTSTTSTPSWPVKHASVMEGNVILGGLMMVHSREDSITCGPIMPQGGIQALEAMLYTLDQVNKQQLLPNITLGAHILDDCDKDTYGLEMAVDFIKGSISNIDDAEYHCNKTTVRKVISGVVGAASSVSFFSTSPELSNKQRFEYFSRTIPSDHYQVKAMVEIVKRMGWSYVSIIYEESNYGIKAFEELEELLARHNICIAVKEKLVKDSGAIIFGSDQEVEGTLSVQPQANPVKGFEEYFLNLTVENNQRNPWFVEFWEDHFQCRYPGSTSTPYNNYNRTCTTTERLSREDTDFEDQLQDMHRDLCGGRPSLCDAMKPTKGADLLKYLRKVQFQGLSGDHFRFDSNGDGPARYNIIHFKQSNEGQYHWVQFKLLHPKPPESVCSLPCERGQAKKYVEGESCCWHCFNCSTYQIRHPLDETQCIKCELGTLPDATKQFCQTIPEILINGVWMLIAPSHAKHYHPTREDNLLVCDSYIDASYVIAFFYPIVLIVVCTVYAVLTRKIPEAFNESKHIGFTMYTTCVIWLAFVPLYFGTANHVPLRITSMSVTISLSASVTIACLFSPKLYIILIRPERNVRQSMMPPRYTNMHRTANTGPSSMMAAAVVTAATCAQEEKIQKHITPTNTEHSVQKKKLCEMATQTITITSIFTNLDSTAYNQIPYADQYVPNNNHNEPLKCQHNYVEETTTTPTSLITATNPPTTTECTTATVIATTKSSSLSSYNEKHKNLTDSKSSDNLFNSSVSCSSSSSSGSSTTGAINTTACAAAAATVVGCDISGAGSNGGSLSSRNGSTKGSQTSNNNVSTTVLNSSLSRESSTGKKRCAIPV
ncbi:Metabotropic glutamate receptor 8 [Lucilia cuprina]|nr:Metabotropic glutamate receptor 8 [Lucilia cuprina]